MREQPICEREYDFSLILSGITELTEDQAEALFAAGCDDATPSVIYGRVWLEFSRAAASYKDAVLSAIRDVRRANIGADVERIDQCDLVTQSEIARKIGKTPQYVQQLMTGTRGPGRFPPPECHLTDTILLWAWCSVSFWLTENNIVRPEVVEDLDTAHLINNALEELRGGRCPQPAAAEQLKRELASL
jgi:hypothetical protein